MMPKYSKKDICFHTLFNIKQLKNEFSIGLFLFILLFQINNVAGSANKNVATVGSYQNAFNGGVFDVVIDLRKTSKTFLKHFSIELKVLIRDTQRISRTVKILISGWKNTLQSN